MFTKIIHYLRGCIASIDIHDDAAGYSRIFVNGKATTYDCSTPATPEQIALNETNMVEASRIFMTDGIYKCHGILIPKWRYRLFTWQHIRKDARKYAR